jgi:hypothetical protein
MNGIVDPGRVVKLLAQPEIPTARFTIDGSEPTLSSPLLQSLSSMIVGPAVVKVKTFPNRKAEAQEVGGTFSAAAGAVLPVASTSTKAKVGLRYSFYDGDWNSFPDFKKIKPVESAEVQKDFSLNKFKAKKNAAFLIEGNLEVPEEGYYVFASNAVDGSMLTLGKRVVLETKSDNQGIKSFAVPLKKGIYSFRFELLQKKGSPYIDYYIFRTKSGNDAWWEGRFLTL